MSGLVLTLALLASGCRSDESAAQEHLSKLAAVSESPTEMEALAKQIAAETAEKPARLELVARGLDEKRAKDMTFLGMLAHHATGTDQIEALSRVLPEVDVGGAGLETWGPADKPAVAAVTGYPDTYDKPSRAVLDEIALKLAVNVARKGLDEWSEFNAKSPLKALRDVLHAIPNRKVRLVVEGPDELSNASPNATAEEAAATTRKFERLQETVSWEVMERIRGWFRVSYPLGPLALTPTDTPGADDLDVTVSYSATTTKSVYVQGGKSARGDLVHGLALTVDVSISHAGAVLWEIKDLAVSTPADFKYSEASQIKAVTSKGPGIRQVLAETMKVLGFELDRAVGRD